MPNASTMFSRRNLGKGLLALGATGAATAIGVSSSTALPSSPSNLVVGWGSSSMAGGLSNEAGNFDFLSGLGSALGRQTKNFGVGATNMQQNLAVRGTRTVELTFPDGAIPASKTEVQVTPSDKWVVFNGLSFPGIVSGVHGSIVMRDGAVFFTRTYEGKAKRLPGGVGQLRSSLATTYKGSYHVYWMGKNNLGDPTNHQFVLDGTLETWALPGPRHPEKLLQMGQWKTYRDGDAAARGVRFLNDGLREALGANDFVDVTEVVTSEDWLTRPVVADLRLLDSAEHREQIAQGLPPRALVGSDGMHFNARGNQLVAAAAAEKAIAKGWSLTKN